VLYVHCAFYAATTNPQSTGLA